MKKCPYCAEEIQDEAVICRFCGRDLRPAIQTPPLQRPVPPQPTRKKTNWLLITIILIFCIGLFCVVPSIISALKPTPADTPGNNLAVISEPTNTSANTVELGPSPTPSIKPSATPSTLTIAEIERNYSDLTDIQWKDYAKSITGLRVHWKGTVNEVYTDGDISVDVGEDLFHSVFLDGIPKDVAKNVNKGQAIEFEAIVRRVSTFLGLTIWLDNVVIIQSEK